MKRKGSLLIALGLVLLLAAAGLTGWNLYEGYRAQQSSQQLVQQLEAVVPPAPAVKPEVQPNAAGEVEIPDYILNPHMNMPEIDIDGRAYIGTLELPSLGLEFPIISRWSYGGLRVSPCRYTGSAYSDDLVLAAHNYNSHFGKLKTLHEGDSVFFTDTDGNRFAYTVAVKETLMPTAVEEMTDSGYPLTLFTCTLGGSYRVTIRCDKAETN